jgi:NifU-like protein involved in Fe-S cluster formation
MNNVLVESYIQNPVYNKIINNTSISQYEWNALCGDNITIYLEIENNIIKNYGYTWESSTITKAWASFLWDIILWINIYDIIDWNIKTLESQDFIVSTRRKRAAVIALLATKNAIYKYLQIEKKETFDDILYKT